MERFLRSLCEPIKPWWISVVMYFTYGIILIVVGATSSGEKTTIILVTTIGILFIFVSIFGVVMRPLTRK